MTTVIKWRGGTTNEHSSFVGENREVTVDVTKKTLVVHDGVTPGGFPLARASDIANVSNGTGLSKDNQGNLNVKYGTTAGTATEGNDTRVANALQKTNNLSDLDNASTARTNLGLGSVATLNVSQSRGTDSNVVMSQLATTNAIMPVGSTYIQFPGKPSPSSIFQGTWEQMYNGDGVFFRTEGSGASAFGAGIQGDAIRNITGTYQHLSYGSANATGPFENTSSASSRISIYLVGSDDWVKYMKFDASKVVPTANENRPRNITVRVWTRTA